MRPQVAVLVHFHLRWTPGSSSLEVGVESDPLVLVHFNREWRWTATSTPTSSSSEGGGGGRR